MKIIHVSHTNLLLYLDFLDVNYILCVLFQALIGQHTFKLLPTAYQYKLIQLLPECDRFQLHDGQLRLVLSLSLVICCRAGSGYPNGYPVLGNSRGGFSLPSSRFVITCCDQSFPSPWHCLSVAPSLSGATLLSTLQGIPLSATWGHGWSPQCPSRLPISHISYIVN